MTIDISLGADKIITTEPAAYRANGTLFDGVNDWLTKTGALSGAVASKLLTGSLWFKNNDNTRNHILLRGNNDADGIKRFQIIAQSNGFFVVDGSRSTSAVTLQLFFSGFIDMLSWHHIMWSADLTNGARRHMYLDDVDVLEAGTHNNFDIDFPGGDRVSVGANFDSGSKTDGGAADLWWHPGPYLDLTVVANRRKFIDASGKPVFLGFTGDRPTGSAPPLFLSGVTADWHVNRGTGGGLIESGALSDAPSSPSD